MKNYLMKNSTNCEHFLVGLEFEKLAIIENYVGIRTYNSKKDEL